MTGKMNVTPAMRQYLEIKERHRDCILFFRMGDFYEMFFEDAVTASKILEITLTSRNKGKEDSVPLCGIPYHASSSYIAKLVDKGFKVAICEQTEDPKEAKGIVKREVVRIITPGLYIEGDNRNVKDNAFLAALAQRDDTFGLAFLDVSTGEFRITESKDREYFIAEMCGLNFREIIIDVNFEEKSVVKALSQQGPQPIINYLSSEYFNPDQAEMLLQEYFTEGQLSQQGIYRHTAAVAAAGAILKYVADTQKSHLRHINAIEWYETDSYLVMDNVAKRNLELFSTIADTAQEGSLFHVLDETVTSMGSRKLRWWLSYPLIETAKIRERLVAVSEIKDHHIRRENIRKALARVYDLERLAGRVSIGVLNGRDLIAMKSSLRALPDIKALIAAMESPFIKSILIGIDEMPDILDLIERSIVEEPPMTIREGGIIKKGYDTELDELISISTDGKKWIAALEEKERKRTGIHSLKVGFNSVFGYYIEITKANTDLVPDDYIRKQTLVNAERYINQELKGYEYTVLSAEDRRREREYELFVGIREKILQEIARIQQTAFHIASLDACASLAEAAEKYNYCCPVVDDDDRIEINNGRHPVVERMPLPDGFVPNDAYLDLGGNRLLLITGPNMAGKSTYIRQIAHIVILAQMGSFVPAEEARIGIVDRIFTRIGAADILSRGQSTFMVEMNEVAHILRNATHRSLIILDEVGRGTSTFDGLSIAWATAEYIHDERHIGARTLFATHYHQLTDLAITKEGIKNFNIAVKEWGDRIIFLRKIMEGGTNRSYGIQVARIAGVPAEVVVRAKEILHNLEKGEFDEVGMPRIARGRKSASKDKAQLSLFMDEEDFIVNELKTLDILNMTPMDALQKLSLWKDKLQS